MSGLTTSITKKSKAGKHTSRVTTPGKSPNSAMSHGSTTKISKPAKRVSGVRTSGSSPNTQMTKGSTTKVSRKATTRVSGNTRVFAD